MRKRTLIGLGVLGIIAIRMLSSCRTIPKGVYAVEHFDSKRYLGKWYEIARMDYRFEKNMNNVTATYSLNPDGSIKVDNRGYNFKKGKWKEAIGKAKFVSSPDIAKLKVSFFGPFYAGYNVIAIDKDYNYALVVGKSLEYLWLLCREKQMPEKIKNNYVQLAEKLGFNVSELIWVEQNK